MLCRVLRTKQAKHVRRSAPIFTSIILDAQEKSAKRKRAGFFAASCGCVAEPRPADEAGEAQRKRGAACGRNSRAGVGAAVQIYERAATCDGNLANSNQRGRGLNFQAHCMRAGNSGHRNPDETGKACQAQRSDFYKHHPGCAGKIGKAQESRLLCRVLWLRSRAASSGRNSEDRKPQQGIQGAETGFPEGVPARHAREAPQEKRGCFCARARPRAWQRVRPKQQAVRRRM